MFTKATVRIQVLSDLHFEFQRDGGRSLVESCHVPDVDVLVLAGDIAVAHGIEPALELFSQRYAHVVYVHGNHEFYGSNRDLVTQLTRDACERLGNVHWLDCDVIELCGRRFVGAPLWFAESEAAKRYRRVLNDYSQIADYETWVYSEHRRACAFLEEHLRQGDVVVSHHLPVWASVLDEFRGSPLNCYFVSDMEPLIRARRPALWLHGHTHGSVDLTIGDTRVVCNPFGYARRGENPRFEEKRVVELATSAG